MRKLILAICVLALLFCGWWVFAAMSVSSGVSAWFDDRRTEGWQADLSNIGTSGFPTDISTVVTDINLADPETNLAISLPDLTISARAIWPGDMHIALPSGPIGLATPQSRIDVFVDDGRGDLNLAPGTALDIRNLSFTSGPFRASGENGGLFAGDAFELRAAQTSAPQIYDLTFEIGQFTPGAAPRKALLIPESWPLVFSALGASATVEFDRAWDRRALEDRRPQPRRINLHNAEAQWGDIRIRLAGALDVDAAGSPTGDVVVKAENWQSLLTLAEIAGLLDPDLRPTVEGVLRSLAAGSGRTNDLDVTLSFANGLISMGFLPLAPAPRIALR